MAKAPLLVLAIGNPSRGDDALGPLLLERLQHANMPAAGDVELLTDFQLQVEHALDVEGRQAVLFVDAAHAGTSHGATITPIFPDTSLRPGTHVLRPQAVLQVALQLTGRSPPAWLLAVEGQHFALGEGLSTLAEQHLDGALLLARAWLAERMPLNAPHPETSVWTAHAG